MYFVPCLVQNLKAKERNTQHGKKKVLRHLGSRILDEEDPPEYSGGGLSSEEEVLLYNVTVPFFALDYSIVYFNALVSYYQDNDRNHFCVAMQTVEGQPTMADLFNEAFSRMEAEVSPFPTSKHSGSVSVMKSNFFHCIYVPFYFRHFNELFSYVIV